MPVVFLKNVGIATQQQIVSALSDLFPEKLNEICINLVLEHSPDGPHAHVHGSSNTSPEVIVKIKETCARFVEVRKRKVELLPKPYIIYYGLGQTLLKRILEATIGALIRWVPADPRLLNNVPAPYVEIHEDPDTSWIKFDTVNRLLDAEVFHGKKMTFYPRTTPQPAKDTQ